MQEFATYNYIDGTGGWKHIAENLSFILASGLKDLFGVNKDGHICISL